MTVKMSEFMDWIYSKLPDAIADENEEGELIIATGLRADARDVLHKVGAQDAQVTDALRRAQQEATDTASNLAVNDSSVTPNDDDRSFAAMVGLVADLGPAQVQKVARIFATYRWALERNQEAAQKGCAHSESG